MPNRNESREQKQGAPTRKRIPIVGRLNFWLGLSALIVLIGAWDFSAHEFFTPIFFPPPEIVAHKGFEMMRDGSLFSNAGVSLQRILIGFFIGSAIGAPIGLLMGASHRVRAFLDVYVEFFRFIPSIAWLTPAIIWFGVGETAKIFIIIYTTVFVVILNTAAGVQTISQDKVRAARSLGASHRQVFVYVTVPATVPFVLTGMRIAMANSFTTVVSAELLAASSGLGVLIWNARTYFQTDVIFVSMITLGILGFSIDRIFRSLIKRFAGRFHE